MVLALVAQTPPSNVEDVEPGTVRVVGAVVPSEYGIVREPTSGTEVVWYRVTAQWLDVSPDGQRRTWRDLFTEGEARDFDVISATDHRARIAASAAFVLPGDQFGSPPEIQVLGFSMELRHLPMTPALAHWVHQRTEKSPKTIRVQRWMLTPGTRVSAFGVAARSGNQVRLGPHPSASEVVVTTVDDATLNTILRRRRLNAQLFTGIGLLLVLAGTALLLL